MASAVNLMRGVAQEERRPGMMRRADSVTTSVGRAIESGGNMSSAHPVYQAITDKFRAELQKIMERENEKRNNAEQAVNPIKLEEASAAEVASVYPELRVVQYPVMSSPHGLLKAHRMLTTQLMVSMSRTYAPECVVYGYSGLQAIAAKPQGVHLHFDANDPSQVQSNFQDELDCLQAIDNALQLAEAKGLYLQQQDIDNYRNDLLLRRCCEYSCQHTAGAFVVDGMTSFLSVGQFMGAMIQHNSEIGFMSVPYTQEMLVNKSGVFGSSGVSFEFSNRMLRFRYPDGVIGVTSVSSDVWQQWLANTTRRLPSTSSISFNFELHGVRGPFMIVRVTKLESAVVDPYVSVHSLPLAYEEEYVVVKCWMLKDLAGDPRKSSSWQLRSVLCSARTLVKTYEYALSVPQSEFSRYNIRVRLSTVNDKVFVSGSDVRFNTPLDSESLNALEVAITAKAFVARYEIGKVSKELKGVLDELYEFSSKSSVWRLGCAMYIFGTAAYDYSLGIVVETLSSIFKTIASYLSLTTPKHVDSFSVAPSFIRYEHWVNVQGSRLAQYSDRLRDFMPTVDQLLPGVTGFGYIATTESISNEPIGYVQDDKNYSVVDITGQLYSDIVDTRDVRNTPDGNSDLTRAVRSANPVDNFSEQRHTMPTNYSAPTVEAVDFGRDDYTLDPGYITTLTDVHDAFFPGMTGLDFKSDLASMVTDDQDRMISAEYLTYPLENKSLPNPMQVYASKLRAYDVTKRPVHLQETLSALIARNTRPPVASLPQDDDLLADEIVENFKAVACLPDVEARLLDFQDDPVAFEEGAIQDWENRAKPEKLDKVIRFLVENPTAWEDLNLSRYGTLNKPDVKPPLSDKPLYSRLEAQTLVTHETHVVAFFSSIFRVLTRRLLSIMRPEYLFSILKSNAGVRDHIQANHEWGVLLKFLENDFSKFDKSQGRLALLLETKVFMMLGMNVEMLEAWKLGHVDCSISSPAMALALVVKYQRKSGDATTAFGNGIINMMSVLYAYRGSDIVWGVFMGDDSLLAVRSVVQPEIAVRTLAERMNLMAKFYITDYPYFASSFVLVHDDRRKVTLVPDPIKRIQRWSVAVPALEPRWVERYVSAVDDLAVYRHSGDLMGLGEAVSARYKMEKPINVDAVGGAFATAISTAEKFRAIWNEQPEVLRF